MTSIMHQINFLLFLFLIFSVPLFSQAPICDGNLGENIFEDGDFGSGITNILNPDPNIAPGYNYTFLGPPNDGFYLITNNTGAWPGLYPTWLAIQDNSNDPQGYMMVVNASFNPGLFYEQIIDDLCDNTVYEFSADIINLIASGVSGHIAPNVSFLINDEVEFSTGNIPQNNQWNTYGFTFETLPGQTTVKLSLRNEAPGGIGNDLALDNITFRACGPQALILPTAIENICLDGDPVALEATINGDQYPTPSVQWQQSFDEGLTWVDIPGETSLTYIHTELVSGFYYYRYLLANSPTNLMNTKCRVNSNVKVVHVLPEFFAVTDTICDGGSFLVGNQAYTETGIYIDSLISSIGCDSILTLDLTVLPDLGISADILAIDPTCTNDTNGSFSIENIQNAYPPVQIEFASNIINANTATFENLEANNYNIVITDNHGCSLEQTIVINNPVPFSIDVGPDLMVDLGDFIQINTSSNYTIDNVVWEPEIDIECFDGCLRLTGIPTNSNQYIITAISELGCVTTDTLFIEVNAVRDVYIPNAFSPNDDGFNDVFTVFGKEPAVEAIEEFRVFNRWGSVVFEAENIPPNDQTAGWDGKFGGKSLGADVYIYQISLRYLDGVRKQFSGDILLLK